MRKCGRVARSTDNTRLGIGAIDPVDRTVLAWLEKTVLLEDIDTDARHGGVLLGGDEDDSDADLEGGLLGGESGEEIGDESDVTETVGGATTVELVAVAGELEGVDRPLGGIGGDDVEMGADKRDHFVGGAGVLDDEIATARNVGDVTNLERTAVRVRERIEHATHMRNGAILLRHMARRIVLQVLSLANQTGQSADKASFVELQIKGRHFEKENCLKIKERERRKKKMKRKKIFSDFFALRLQQKTHS
jgi:hypothetical protein